MDGSVFFGAVPYSEALGRLSATFALKRGDLLTHGQLSEVIQAPAGSNRYRGVIEAWKKRTYSADGMRLSGEGRARGIGIMVCTAAEEKDLYVDHLRGGIKKVKRTAKGLNTMDVSGLDQAQLAHHNIARRVATEIAAHGVTKIKELPSPGAVKPSNIRLFKAV